MPLPAGGIVVISGSDLEAREDMQEAFGDYGLGVWALRGPLKSTEVKRWVRREGLWTESVSPGNPPVSGRRGLGRQQGCEGPQRIPHCPSEATGTCRLNGKIISKFTPNQTFLPPKALE